MDFKNLISEITANNLVDDRVKDHELIQVTTQQILELIRLGQVQAINHKVISDTLLNFRSDVSSNYFLANKIESELLRNLNG